MTRQLQVQIISMENIIPSCPTPQHLRNFKLSLLDQISAPEYADIVLFYTVKDDTDNGNIVNADQISQRLKSSLSETLTKFYPFAGKIKDHVSIECNDDGVEYVEAQANCLLSEFLQEPDPKLLRKFLIPIHMESPKARTGPLLLVQVTFFKCGGVAIGICTSHKLVDGWTGSIFIRSWASMALGSGEKVLPEYIAQSVFPPDESLVRCSYVDTSEVGLVTKRFVFDSSKIHELKAKVASASVPNPTRVEAVTALIWKCTMTVSRSNRGLSRLSLLLHAMNLRRMIVPPLPDNSVGNIVGYFSAQTMETEIKLQDLVCLLRKGKEEFINNNGLKTMLETKILEVIPELENKIKRDEIDYYQCASLCRFPFYDANFGWGKPIWVSMPDYTLKNLVMLLGAKDGEGIEALVSLRAEDMALFERDQELLAFAAFNPPVLLHTTSGVAEKTPLNGDIP